MENSHYVPGNDRYEFGRYKGKQLWQEIMQVTEIVACLYADRVHNDFNNRVTKECSKRAKAGLMCYLLEQQTI